MRVKEFFLLCLELAVGWLASYWNPSLIISVCLVSSLAWEVKLNWLGLWKSRSEVPQLSSLKAGYTIQFCPLNFFHHILVNQVAFLLTGLAHNNNGLVILEAGIKWEAMPKWLSYLFFKCQKGEWCKSGLSNNLAWKPHQVLEFLGQVITWFDYARWSPS